MRKSYLIFISAMSLFLISAGTIDFNALFNYSVQPIPAYISQDNTPGSNPITDEAATLGRVLFYDKNLSLTNSVSCSSCHKQAFAFGDSEIQSEGHDGGLTGRHSPRLSNARFSEEQRFFWDERASSLEIQSTMPIQDHIEMGFSGANGDPGIDSLIAKMESIFYYDELFNLAYEDQNITEGRMQNALAQFIRSMQSFDSKYDVGRAQVGNDNTSFPNFTTEENNGKALYMSNMDTGCNRCHRAPEFDIDPDSRNNGVIGVAGSPGSIDVTNERSPSLRDIVNASGTENGPYMHDGSLSTLMDVIDHYDDVPNDPANTNLDNRLAGPGGNLNLSTTEKAELLAFLKTLGGSNLYTDEKWSDPFDVNGNLAIINGVLPIELAYFHALQQNQEVHLEWETLVEINNEGFEVLHSTDIKEWEVLDFIEGENRGASYAYIHPDPSVGKNYYRLKQIDFDGQYTYSDIRAVEIEQKPITLNVYPNPTSDYIYIDGGQGLNRAYLHSSNGELVLEVEINETARIDLSTLESGLYLLTVSDTENNTTEVRKIVRL